MGKRSQKYRIAIQWDESREDYLVMAPELENCNVRAGTQLDALSLINEAIEAHLRALEKQNLPVPPPLQEKKFSGRIALRIDPSLHHEIALQAALVGIPVTHFIEKKLRRR